MRIVTITPDEGESREYLIPYGSRLIVKNGARIKPGDKITEGSINPHDILRICGLRETQRYLVYEVQKVYKSQGVGINDKHIEVMVRQMLHKVKIEDSGDTDFLLVNILISIALNLQMLKLLKKAVFQPLLVQSS